MSNVATKEDVKGIVDKSFDDLYSKLSKHFDLRFDKIESYISSLDKKYEHLIATLDSFLKRLDDAEVDDIARDAQLARL